MRRALTLLVLPTLVVACSSNDAEKCPVGERTTELNESFANLGYPDGTVACVLPGLPPGVEATAVFYNGINEDAAAAKLSAFMSTKGYRATTPEPSPELEGCPKGGTELSFQREGDSVRYYAWLTLNANGDAVAVLEFFPVDCAKNPKEELCK
ncbi:MAG: hypothetical protein HOW73_22515 [Polyangiaceae bacterium]|nr:hypothetical protein [Polyangiaceae bacterium]